MEILIALIVLGVIGFVVYKTVKKPKKNNTVVSTPVNPTPVSGGSNDEPYNTYKNSTQYDQPYNTH
jgi:hypothetical protein